MRRSSTLGAVGLFLAACGGGGSGGGGGGGGGTPEPAGDVAAVTVAAPGAADDLFIVDNTGTLGRSVRGAVANSKFAIELGSTFWNPARTRVAYVGDPTSIGSFHLLVADPTLGTTADLTPAAPTGRFISQVVWSTDGAFLAFTANFDDAALVDLYTVAVGGGAVVRVDAGAASTNANHDVSSFVWKPNAHRLGYTGDLDVDEQRDAYVVDADGTNLVRVARPGAGGADVEEIGWSDDGHRLAFRTTLVNASLSIYLFSSLDDGTGVRIVGLETPSMTVGGFRWEPGASNRLAYSFGGTGPSDAFTLFRGNADTGVASAVGPVGQPGLADLTFFRYAEAGTLVYAQRFDLPFPQGSLRRQPAGGADTLLEGVPGDPSLFGVLEFEPSPDGRRIAYRFRGDAVHGSGDLFVVNADGTDRRRVNDELPVPPEGGFVASYEWSPDSSRLAYSTLTDAEDAEDVYVVPAAGGAPSLVSTERGTQRSLGWTSDSAFVLWRKRSTGGPDQVFLATADGSVTRPLSPGLSGEGVEVTAR